MAEPVPAPIFFGGSRQAIDLMHQSGMTEMSIAMVLIEIRAAAIAEERLRVEWIALNYPPCAGIRPQDIIAEISGHQQPENNN
jgi:hypothetical protein